MALRDTLRAATAQDEASVRFETDKPALIERWRASIVTLHNDVSRFLHEYLADGSLSIETEDVEVREDVLGAYSAQVMTLRAGQRIVRIQPIARIIIGAVGRVDMYRQGRPNADDRYRLIRTVDDTQGNWGIRRPPEFGTGPGSLQLVTKETFEAALDALLS